jgi:hypothetical protein
MGNVAAGFNGKNKLRRSGISPFGKSSGTREMIKRRVNLHRIKKLRIVGKPLILRQMSRIKHSLPMRIRPTRSPYPGLFHQYFPPSSGFTPSLRKRGAKWLTGPNPLPRFKEWVIT